MPDPQESVHECDWCLDERPMPDSTLGQSVDSTTPVPHSPIADAEDGFGVPSELGREIRRARLSLQLVYDCDPGEFIDIEARVRDAVTEFVCNELGSAVIAMDLTEHVKLGARGAVDA